MTNYSMYADDTDLYLIFKPSELTENVAEMERTAGLVRRWMASNELKMNDAKTEVMLITPRRMAMKIEWTTVIGDHVVAPSHFVRNLGVILDSLAGMERQINAVCKTSYMHLYNISKIRYYLDKHSLACIIHALVTCRLDYGNALLCGYPESQIQKRQRVQNVAARLKPGVHTNEFAPIRGRPVRIHTAPAEDNTSNQQSTPQALCEYARGDRESGRNR